MMICRMICRSNHTHVIPAKTGIGLVWALNAQIPAFAGMTPAVSFMVAK